MWSRLDWKSGRFNINIETTLIHRGLRAWQHQTGDSVLWWRFDYSKSEMHPIYDEATGAGRVFYGPWFVPTLSCEHIAGANTEPREEGLYQVDELHVVAEFDQLQKIGLTYMDLQTANYRRDRLAYDNKLFQIQELVVLGQIRRRDIIVSITALQIKNDELVDDPMYSWYLNDPTQHSNWEDYPYGNDSYGQGNFGG